MSGRGEAADERGVAGRTGWLRDVQAWFASGGLAATEDFVGAFTSVHALTRHANAERVALPDAVPVSMSLDKAMIARRSRRDYMRAPLSTVQLSTILRYACGVGRQTAAYGRTDFSLHFVPSQGALHPIDTYVVVNRVEGWIRGLYHYDAQQHSLARVEEGNLRHRVTRCCYDQDWVRYADAVLALVGCFDKVDWKYGRRSYRYVHVDAGLLCEAIYLLAAGLGLNTCAVAAFDDEAVSDLLGLDPGRELPILLMPLGAASGPS